MLRNREVQILLLSMGALSLVAILVGAFFSRLCFFLLVLTCVLLIGCSLLFTRWRYREIERLTGYLCRISSGEYELDVRDNCEGELSILKNEIYKVTQTLAEQASLLQRDKIQLTNAISDISHQLKTPLTSLLVMTDLLCDAQVPPAKRVEFTHNIRLQLERMEWLVSSLLKLAKIDAGAVQFKKEPVAVKELVKKALDPVLIPLDIKEQSVSISGDDAITFRGDLNWTAEALLNILKNCVEHTPVGGRISISFAENALFTEIVIADNGKGIPREDLPYIFKRFYKGKNASPDSIGIGLAMAYSIITGQNGDIEVKSGAGKGTEFRIKFYKQLI